MEDKNSELLFEYLRSILYDKKIQPLDVEQLDEPFRKLGRGLQYFAKTFTETKQYAAALSRGNLSVQPPPRENFLCENLKNIHANLNHLTWQAKQVAKGDYSQTVSYLGEFSEAFNTMTQQLKERELKLKQEAEREKIHAGMVETYNQLLVEMIDRSEEEIFVTSADGRRILYCKKRNDRSIDRNEVYQMCIRFAQKHRSEESRDSFEWIWEAEDSRHHFYRIITGYMQWQGGTGLSLYYPGCDEREAAGRTSEDGSEPRWADTDRKPSLFPGEGRGYAERREQSDLLLLRSGSSEIYQ